MAFICLIAILLWSTIQCLQTSSESLDYYTAAIAEYRPIHVDSRYRTAMVINGQNYEKFIKTASENDVDIIVFPEYGLFGQPEILYFAHEDLLHAAEFIPDPEDEIVPCNNTWPCYSENLKRISCMAKKYAIYVVINLSEKTSCGDMCVFCKTNHQLYSTNVAFNRVGAVIGRYRKWNLFHEDYYDLTLLPEISTFETDFNVTFGLLTGHDLMYATPTLELLREQKITDLACTSYWFHQLPWQLSPGVKAAFSYINDVNLLVSGINIPRYSMGGIGIYAGKNGIIKSTYAETRNNALIIGKVPKIINGERRYPINPDDSKIINFTTQGINTISENIQLPPINLVKETGNFKYSEIITHTEIHQIRNICIDEFCCIFLIQTAYNENLISNSTNYYRYRLAAYKSKRPIEDFEIGFNVCGVVGCVDNETENCGGRFTPDTNIINPLTFKYIEISVIIKPSENIVQFPTSSTIDMVPLNINEFQYVVGKITDELNCVRFVFIEPSDNLLTFGLIVRNFTADTDGITMLNQLESTTLFPVTQP